MTTKTEKLEKTVVFPEPPMYFADQPAALMLGPLVSRITFGTEEMDDGPYPRPIVTIAMPTPALLQFVNDVKAALDAPNFKKQAIDQLNLAARLIQGGGKVTPNDQKIETKPKSRQRKLSLSSK